MSNQSTRIEKQAIILNNKKGNLVTTYYLEPGALGDFGWRRLSIKFERTDDNVKAEKQYSIESKESARLNGISVTIFQVFELYGDAWVHAGTFNVESKGIARDATCLKAWLTREH